MTPWHIRQAARTLSAGGVIAYPTETVYGLGCDPLNVQAVNQILNLKQRPMEKGLILIAASLEQLMPYIAVSNPALLDKLQQPGTRPTTWITPARPGTPQWLTGSHDTIAVRISQHPVVCQLCMNTGSAIVSTSANPSRLTPAHNALAVRRYFGDRLDYLLTAHTKRQARPSQIKTLLDDKILREH